MREVKAYLRKEKVDEVVRAHVITGEQGHDVVFVSPVDHVLKIRTGAEVREALR